jgi:outer membrane protein insertion porin family
MMKRFYWLLVMLLAFSADTTLRAQQDEGPEIRDIKIEFDGTATVNEAIVRSNIRMAVGKHLTRDMVEQDVRNLIGTGYFFDVRVAEESVTGGVRVIFRLQGKATLTEVVFEGSERYKDERLRREVSQKPGDILDSYKAHQDALKILEMYQKAGYPDAKVDPKITIDKDTGKAILRYVVFEGDRVRLQKIEIHGNRAIKTSALLKLMKTRHHWWGSWLSGTGIIKEDQLHEDLDKLRDHYQSQGYIDVEVRGTRVERVSQKWMILHIDLYEGTQYKAGIIKIEGAKIFSVADVQKRLKMTTGQLFTPDGINKDTKAIEDYYSERGYLDTNAQTTRVPNIDTGRIDITYTIREGELAYIELIEIRGNTKTKDKVIRRELAVAPGDIYNTVRVDRSVERLKNLGFFEREKGVQARHEPTPIANRKNLTINVEEARTGNVTFGAGFSSIDSLVGFLEVTQGNFDLFNPPTFTGAGQKVRIRAQTGLKRQDYILSFTEPWFLDKQLSFGFDIFHTEANYFSSVYNESRTGGDVRIGKAINQFLRFDVQYGIQLIEESMDPTYVSQELYSQRGHKIRSSVQTSLSYDRRDSVFITTRGTRSEVSAEVVGGPFGGDVSIYKLNAKTTWFFPLFNGHIVELLGAGGVVGAYGQSKGSGPVVKESDGSVHKVNDVPLFDRYFLGGANSLRGWSYHDISPRDVNGQPVGGNTYVNTTFEYTIPIVDRVRFAFFADAGEVESDAYAFKADDLRADFGSGVRLNLPIGPLRLDYGIPIKPRLGSGKIQFSVGYQF